jgi:hypothetical protein
MTPSAEGSKKVEKAQQTADKQERPVHLHIHPLTTHTLRLSAYLNTLAPTRLPR